MPGPRFGTKSPGGTLAYMATGLAVWRGVCVAGYAEWKAMATLVCLVGAVCELVSWRVDDNMVAPVSMGVVAWLFG